MDKYKCSLCDDIPEIHGNLNHPFAALKRKGWIIDKRFYNVEKKVTLCPSCVYDLKTLLNEEN